MNGHGNLFFQCQHDTGGAIGDVAKFEPHEIENIVRDHEIAVHHRSVNWNLNVPKSVLWGNIYGAKRQVARPSCDI
jgi:hypothetical protein